MDKKKSCLRPAILFRAQLEEKFAKLYYTDDMFYYNGSIGCWPLSINDTNELSGAAYHYQYAIVNKNEEPIGYVTWSHDYYENEVYSFGLISFDKGNPYIGYAMKECMDEFVNKYKVHRMEWRMIGGNPVHKHYKKFADKLGGREIILKDTTRDKYGNYHDDYIYEIIDPYDHLHPEDKQNKAIEDVSEILGEIIDSKDTFAGRIETIDKIISALEKLKKLFSKRKKSDLYRALTGDMMKEDK